MNYPFNLDIRHAQLDDVEAIANIYVDSWRETYAGILPSMGLLRMSPAEQASQWTRTIKHAGSKNPVMVAVDNRGEVFGFSSAGASRDPRLGYDSEIYTLYVTPGYTDQGIGSALMRSMFNEFSTQGSNGIVIWALAENPSRFFYQALGGKIIAEREHPMWGGTFGEIAYAWRELNLVSAKSAAAHRQRHDSD